MFNDEIISIEECGDTDTIDITVSGNHLFYANDILTHNSGIKQENPGLDSISESMGLAMTADFLVGLWRNEGDEELDIIRMGLMKNRFGPNFGTKPFSIDYTTLTVSEQDDPESEADSLSTSARSVLDALDGGDK